MAGVGEGNVHGPEIHLLPRHVAAGESDDGGAVPAGVLSADGREMKWTTVWPWRRSLVRTGSLGFRLSPKR